MVEKYINTPDAQRVIEGLRDTGYQFETAVADIIDNSIAAEADTVDLRIDMDFAGKISVSIADDGCGMNRVSLIEGMRYGAPKRPDPMSLGKFGLGLKTASTAFCKNLSVISKDNDSDYLKATWDLDHIAEVGDWELLLDDASEEETEHLRSVAGDSPGTVVVWTKVDRILKRYQEPGGNHAKKALKKNIANLSEHVSMVYQRFLDANDDRAKTVTIKINGKVIPSWDPFLEDVSELVAADSPLVELDENETSEFHVRAYVIPHKDEFSDPESLKYAKISNAMQGIYVYRENRLIHGPDWLKIWSKEPHGTLLRVEFSFDHTLDDAFHVDIKKSQILLNDELYDWLSNVFLPAPRRAADNRYRKGVRTRVQERAEDAHDPSNNRIRSKSPDIDSAEVTPIAGSDTAKVRNREGTFIIKLKHANALKPGQDYVQPVDSIDDGLLWEPAIISTNKAVRVNTGHPYYHKVYVPNLNQNVLIQGMDSLMWALSVAELNTVNETVANNFVEMRAEVSRILRQLVSDMPEPDLGDDDT